MSLEKAICPRVAEANTFFRVSEGGSHAVLSHDEGLHKFRPIGYCLIGRSGSFFFLPFTDAAQSLIFCAAVCLCEQSGSELGVAARCVLFLTQVYIISVELDHDIELLIIL